MFLSVVNVLAQGPTTPLPQNQQKWNTNGNSVTSTDFIGTTNATSLIFRTNNLKALEIDPNGNLFLKNLNGQGEGILKHDQNGKIDRIPFNTSFTQVLSSSGVWKEISTFTGLQVNNNDIVQTTTGNFGIGTSVPQAKLDVTGNVKVTGDVNMLGNLSVQGLRIDFSGGPIGPASPCISLLSFDPASNVVTPINVAGIEAAFDALPEGTPLPCPSIEIPFTWATYGNHVNTNNRWIGTIENFDFRIKTNSILRMIVKKDGKVGIGTDSPYRKLTVNGDVSFANYNTNGAGNADDGMNGLEILGNGQTPIRRGISLDLDPNGSFNFFIHSYQNQSAFNFKNGYDGATLMMINKNGNVGIGTDLTSNSYNNTANYFKLSVNGNVRAKEIIVNSAWSDFVFDKNFKLITLAEVEKFIKTNGHLPAIPTAKEIETNGVNLGELVKLQMQKIEELTLYVIELNKKIEANENK